MSAKLLKDRKEYEGLCDKLYAGAMNYGFIILLIGLIVIFASIAMKMSGPGELPIIGEYPQEINPDGYFSYHFFAGLITGIIVLLIGIVSSVRLRAAPAGAEVEEELEMEEEEEVEEEGICPTCGAVIPIDSAVCPECGEELEPPEEEETEEEEEEAIECPICGAEVPADSTECPECGEPLSEEEEEVEEEDLFSEL